ncbi:MAG: MOSC domain-containing protein [Verrucomicrobiota bacterium]
MSEPSSAPTTTVLPVWQGKLRHIYVSAGHDYWGKQGEGRLQSGIQEVSSVECVADMGLRGDRYFNTKPGYKGQVTFFDAAVVTTMRVEFKLPKLPASVFRRNLIVEGISLREWLGVRFEFQGIQFEGTQECKPCHWMDRVVAAGAEEYMRREFRGGLRARVLSTGTLHVG